MTNQQIINSIKHELMTGAGASLPARQVIRFLHTLEETYGDNLDLDEAQKALDSLKDWCDTAKEMIQHETARHHAKTI